MQNSPFFTGRESAIVDNQANNPDINLLQIWKKTAMDVDTTVLHSAFVFGGAERPLTGSVQTSAGLTRYHSAPSALFANLLDDEVFCHEPQLTQTDFEFTQFLCGEFEPVSALSNTRQMVESGVVGFGTEEVQGHSQTETGMEQSPYLFNVVGGALSSISEHGYEEPSEGSRRHQLALSVEQQVTHQRTSPLNHLFKTGSVHPPQAKSSLIRHSSTPADFLSSLLMEDGGGFALLPDMVATTPKRSRKPSAGAVMSLHKTLQNSITGKGLSPAAANPIHTVTGAQLNMPNSVIDGLSSSMPVGVANMEYPAGMNRNGLLRQSSSPARFLSQWSSEALSPTDEKVSMSSSSGDSLEECLDKCRSYANRAATSAWDEVGTSFQMQDDGAFGQRKRGRGLVAKTPQGTATANSARLPMEDSVLCKTRAPRGCATHPRSIAERVRRTRISDKMKKLQELVPNNDKQTNIVDMLDEAVEYVKFLQHQVQELSQNRCKCDGKYLPKASP